jgi:nucleoside-diphosphate-sugar epimerase
VTGVVHSRSYLRNECPDGVELIWGDLERPSSISSSIEHADAVVHCAWDPRQDSPERYTQNNVEGTVDLLRSAISAGVLRFIHISSVAVYGSVPRSDGRAFDEESEIIAEDDALDVYPRTKALLERRLREVAQEGDTKLCIVRPGLLYGHGRPPAKRLVSVGGRGYALLFGDSQNHLPYIHVDDVASLVVRCLDPDSPDIVNAVPTQILSSNDFANRWSENQDSPVRIVRLPLPIARFVALSGYRAKRVLGRPAFRPNVAYQMTTATRNVRYDASLASTLGWTDRCTALDRSQHSTELDGPVMMSSKGRVGRRRVLAVASGGGHWIQLLRLAPALADHEIHFVSVSEGDRDQIPFGLFHVVPDANRWDRVKVVRLAVRMALLVLAVRPHVVLTTGALPGWFAIVLGRLVGARTIWLDSIANASQMSMSGESANRFADVWLTQWPHLAQDDGPEYAGSVL